MTNRIAVYLAAAIVAALLADLVFNDMRAGLFLARRFAALTEYIAFWR